MGEVGRLAALLLPVLVPVVGLIALGRLVVRCHDGGCDGGRRGDALDCQTASKIDPGSACNVDPSGSHDGSDHPG